MPTLSPRSAYHKALASLRQEVAHMKESDGHDKIEDEYSIISRPKVKRSRFHFFTWRRLAVVFSLFLLYALLVSFLVLYQMKKQEIPSFTDARFQALTLTKLLDWLFVPGPETAKREVNGETKYSLPQGEVFNWLATVGVALLGWGSIISIPTLIVDSFVAKAGEQDEEKRGKIRKEEERIAQAKVRGRLEIIYPSYSAVFTKTADPIASVLIESFVKTSHVPWVIVQSGEMYNTVDDAIEHVYFPDLASAAGYDNLLHAARLRGNDVVILATRPGYRFLSDPNRAENTDLTTSDIVTFVENIHGRTHHDVRVTIVGSADAPSMSAPFKGKERGQTTTLADVAREVQAHLIDADEIIFKELFRLSGGTGTEKGGVHGKPIYIEFTGAPSQIEQYRVRFGELLARFSSTYPLHIVADPKHAEGGVFFIGDDVEGVALTQKKLGIFEKQQPHYIVFDRIDRMDEVEDIGFSPLCIDYEIAKAVLKVLTKR